MKFIDKYDNVRTLPEEIIHLMQRVTALEEKNRQLTRVVDALRGSSNVGAVSTSIPMDEHIREMEEKGWELTADGFWVREETEYDNDPDGGVFSEI